jgi:hypothetical protein
MPSSAPIRQAVDVVEDAAVVGEDDRVQDAVPGDFACRPDCAW